MTLLHQIFRQAQSSICLNSPVLLNLTLFSDRLTALRIQITFQKVGIVCGALSIALFANVYSRPFHCVTHKCNISKGRNCLRHCRLALCLAPPFIPNRFSVLRIMQHFKRSELSAALPPALCLAPPFTPDRFTVLRIQITFQKVGTVSGTAAALEFDGICGKVFLDHKSDLKDDSVIELS